MIYVSISRKTGFVARFIFAFGAVLRAQNLYTLAP
jgi:hypothetical protein